jgi:signal transduction histidine kinase
MSPSVSRASLPPDLRRRVQEVADRELALRARFGGVFYLIFLLVVARFTPLPETHPVFLAAAFASCAGFAVLRYALWASYERLHAASPRRWRIAFVVTTLSLGAAWGAFAAVGVVELHGHWASLFVIVSTMGLLSGALVTLVPGLAVYRAFVVLMLGPAIVVMALSGPDQNRAVAILLLAGAGFLVVQARRVHAQNEESLVNRLLLEARARELEEARDRAESASRSKSEFLANVSHEIRTPLNGVLGMTEILLDGEKAADRREGLELIRTSATSLLHVLNDILDLSKLDAGRIEIEVEPFAVREVVERAIAPFALTLRAKGVDLDVAVAPCVPEWVAGDPGRLRQVLANLLSNAAKFTERGRVELAVGACAVPAGRTRLRFRVADTGIGIPAHRLGAIFEPFVQADGSTTRRFGGTGLGLTIASRLVAKMGGALEVESREGVGSSFSFEVELATAAAPAVTAPEAGPPRRVRPLRILVAEDAPVNQTVIRRLLQKEGHDVTVVENGRLAVAAATSEPYDVVLMDVQMPEMDGLAATEAIRAGETASGARVPIVALTAHALGGDRERCLAAGMDGYLTKPVRREELARVLAGAVR